MEELIIRALQRAVTQQEREELDRWRKEDPANERRYQELARIWEMTEMIRPDDPADAPPRARSLIRVAEERRTPKVQNPQDSHRRRGWVVSAALAAGIAVLSFALGRSGIGDADAPSMAGSEIVTGSGELTTVTLSDGSTMRLGPRSRLRIESMGERREVRLDAGRAFFAVDADSTRPFTVRTRDGEAVVLGTRFEVRAEEERLRVLVVEGSVSVSSQGRSVDVERGQMSVSRAGAAPSTQGVDDVLGELAWMGGTLVFRDTPLGQVIRELARWYGVTISLEPPSLRDATVTATFVEQSLEDVMDVICETIMARCRIAGDEVFVERIGVPRSTEAR